MNLRSLGLTLLCAFPVMGHAAIGISTPSVNSGDLIRASDWNKVKLDLETIAAAVGVLQNSTWDSSGADTYYDSGNVGVGINAPTAVIHGYKDSPAANAQLLRLGTNNDADRFTVDEDGDVFMDGKLVVRNNDIYETSGALELSGEDDLTLSMDWNDDDGDIRNILFGKNSAGAGASFVELMRLEETGNLGIGTATPASKLQVAGSIQVGGDAGACDAPKTGAMRYASGAIERCDGTNWDALATTNVSDNLGSHTATQDLDLATFKLVGNAGTEGITIAADGKVGIGAATPSRPLHVRSSDPDLMLDFSDSPSANFSQISFANDGVSNVEISHNRNTEDLTLHYDKDLDGVGNFIISNGTYRFVVNSAGNVGIGESDPDALLQVLKTSPSANEVIVKVGTDTDDNRFSVDEDGDIFADGNAYINGGNVLSGAGSVTMGGEDNLYLAADWNNNDSENRSIIFGKNGIGGGAGWTELARVNENGKVGINTNNPANRLHVVENINNDRIATFENQATTGSPEGLLVLTGQGAGPAPAFAVGTGTEASHTTNFVVTNEGKVGIGNTNPDANVQIVQSSSAQALAFERSGFTMAGFTVSNGASGDILGIGTAGNKFMLAVGTSGTAEGNVGIGTTTPTRALEVNGVIQAGDGTGNDFMMVNSSSVATYALKTTAGTNQVNIEYANDKLNFGFAAGANDMMTLDGATSNVGIGTTIPAAKLQVVGGNIAVDAGASIFATGTGTLNIGDSSDTVNVSQEMSVSGISADGTGKVVCIKSDGNLGTCTDTPNSSGACSCS